MKFFRTKLAGLVVAISAIVFSSGAANATTILDYSGNGSPGVGVELTSGGVFQTIGGAALDSFLNWASFLPVADAFGKVKIAGVSLSGSAAVIASGVYTQGTSGGQIDVYDTSDNLLLAVNFTSGSLLVTASGTGGQFSVGGATFSGLLAQYLVASSASHSISLVNFAPAAIGNNGSLAAASGYGNGLVAGDQAEVPEPATMLLLSTGLLAAARRKRNA